MGHQCEASEDQVREVQDGEARCAWAVIGTDVMAVVRERALKGIRNGTANVWPGTE